MSVPVPPPRRSARRRVLGVALAVLAFPLLELVVAVAVGQLVGGWQTLLVLLAFSVAGVVVLRREGPATWRAFRDTARAGRTPSGSMADGVLVLAGGLLLLLPGLVSDVVGLVCVFPPTRPLARRVLQAWVARTLHRLPSPPGGWSGRPPVAGEVVPGEVVPDDEGEDRPRPGG